jgi:hypothetical protein
MLNNPSGTTDRSDALTCWSAVQILRADRADHIAAPLDRELSRHLDELLSAVSLELEADLESVPKTVRRAAVELAAHITQRSTSGVPHRSTSDRPVKRRGADRRKALRHDQRRRIPFTRSIRLGRMG